MMKIMAESTVYEDGIARDYKYDVIDTNFFYPLEDYVRESLYDEFFDAEIVIPDEEVKKVTEKVQKELDKLL